MSDLNSNSSRHQADPTQWERDLLHEMLMASVAEKRRTRRWGIFFKFLTFGYLFLLLGLFFWSDELAISDAAIKEHTALVEVDGLISSETKASADKVITGLRNAFEDKKTKGVILRMNTPGGSPVQSRYINREIVRLKEKYPDIPVYAVVMDICASGGYYIAAAADKIYADEGSVVGSIGVLINGFGFVDGMEKLGIERRLMTAGENKGILDPFSPLRENDKTYIQGLLGELHQQFIDTVKEGRGDRLQDTENSEIFSGLFWSGEEAKRLGLIDDFGSSSYVAREIIGAEEIVDFSVEEEFWDRFAKRLGTGAANVLVRFSGLGNGLQIQ
ncbi:MAG: S49 family peptidase [Candidatus Thiodiazotropha sp. (ex Monitilora ramsayi)]|nr:S49 family peptidase [Candidatus Thiodiazotropha sp. (ex Monitilora ramsayi)]